MQIGLLVVWGLIKYGVFHEIVWLECVWFVKDYIISGAIIVIDMFFFGKNHIG